MVRKLGKEGGAAVANSRREGVEGSGDEETMKAMKVMKAKIEEGDEDRGSKLKSRKVSVVVVVGAS